MKTKTAERKLKPGPKPLAYIPPRFRHIPGAHEISTRRQLCRLRKYMETPQKDRAPYVRLGASVPQNLSATDQKPSCTYAVSMEGEIQVMKMNQDPRAAERWFRNSSRPWNMAAEFAGKE